MDTSPIKLNVNSPISLKYYILMVFVFYKAGDVQANLAQPLIIHFQPTTDHFDQM